MLKKTEIAWSLITPVARMIPEVVLKEGIDFILDIIEKHIIKMKGPDSVNSAMLKVCNAARLTLDIQDDDEHNWQAAVEKWGTEKLY
jgi:hypothetical protein